MDQRLVAWARAVKSRRRCAPPPLWLFTDPRSMPDLVATVLRLPRGLCGVVFRHDAAPGRAALGRRVLRACRCRRLWMVSAGRPVPGAGLHLRGGRPARPQLRALFRTRAHAPLTASAHGPVELRRALRARAALVFLSPAFATASHPGARPLGAVRWAALARRAGPAHALSLGRAHAFALGGIDGRTALRLPRWVAGAGAIGALSGGAPAG